MPRLRDWIDERRADLRRRASLAAAVEEWETSDRHPDYLLSGDRLIRYDRWAAATPLQLTTTEQEFLAAASRRRRETEEEARRSHEEADRLRRRARTRLWAAAGAVVMLLATIAILFVFVLAEPPRIALVYSSLGREDPGIGTVTARGLDRALDEFDFQVEEVMPITSLADDIESLVAAGTELIVFEGEMRAVEALALAEEYPQVTFAVIDSEGAGAVLPPNVVTVEFAEEQGSFLVGVAAARTTQSGTVGFIGGIPWDTIETFQAGFEAGVWAADPSVEVVPVYLSTDPEEAFRRPELGSRAGRILIEKGADVVYSAAGYSGSGSLEAIVGQNRSGSGPYWHIGVDADEYLEYSFSPELQSRILTSMLKRFDTATYLVIRDYLAGDLEPGAMLLDLSSEGVDVSTSGGFLDQATRQTIEGFKGRIIAGEIEVPRVPTKRGPMLIEMLAEGRAPDPHNADVLAAYVEAFYEGDAGAAAYLGPEFVWPDLTSTFDGYLRWWAAANSEVRDLECRAVPVGAECTFGIDDDLGRALGVDVRSLLVAALEDGRVSMILEDPLYAEGPVLDYLYWVFFEHPAEASAECPPGGPEGGTPEGCLAVMLRYVDDYLAAPDPAG